MRDILEQIQLVSKDVDENKPGAKERLSKLINRLKKAEVVRLKQPNPKATHSNRDN